MDTGKIFLAVVFLLVAAYIFFYVSSPAAKIFGGGILTVLGLLSLVKAFRKKESEKEESKTEESEKEESEKEE